jgi:pimeloyl-ACP methyl ester carboxylesterase
MTPTLAAVAVLVVGPVVTLPTAIWEVSPEVRHGPDTDWPEPIVKRDRAVVLVHGLQLHPIRQAKAGRPELHDWMRPNAALVRALSADFDVYGFGYAQTVPVDVVSVSPGLIAAVGKLKAARYKEIVLVGHSAGGLIARQFVERDPTAGVTKVIQVSAPNAGSELATISLGLPKPQISFIKSLAPGPRIEAARSSDIPIAAGIEFCCVVSKVPRLSGDTLVSLASQWPTDLQRQGIPASLVAANHFDAIKAPHAVERIAELARERVIRWTPAQVETGRQIIFGKDADAAAERRSSRKLKAQSGP